MYTVGDHFERLKKHLVVKSRPMTSFFQILPKEVVDTTSLPAPLSEDATTSSGDGSRNDAIVIMSPPLADYVPASVLLPAERCVGYNPPYPGPFEYWYP